MSNKIPLKTRLACLGIVCLDLGILIFIFYFNKIAPKKTKKAPRVLLIKFFLSSEFGLWYNAVFLACNLKSSWLFDY